MGAWKKSWKRSKDPSKQRKYRRNAPVHQRSQFLNAMLKESVSDRIGTTSLPVRTGDKAEIMRGDFSGLSGQIEDIDYDNYTVYISGIDTERVDGTETAVPIDPSNIKLTKLELSDEKRLSSYEMSEEDKSAIQVEEDIEQPETVEDEKAETDNAVNNNQSEKKDEDDT